MKYILNVDDYCFSKGQVDGTIYAYQNGIVTSTTAMCNMPDEFLEYGAQKSKENPGLAIGCHLNITYGNPLIGGKTLTHPSGRCLKTSEIDYEHIDQEEVYQEFKAQVERFIKFFGRKPTHLDSHHDGYGNMVAGGMKDIVEKVRQEYGLALGRRADKRVFYCENELYNNYSVENFEKIIAQIANSGVEYCEIACHCAFCDEEIFKNSSYNYQRSQEVKVITDPRMKEVLKKYNVTPTHYGEF